MLILPIKARAHPLSGQASGSFPRSREFTRVYLVETARHTADPLAQKLL